MPWKKVALVNIYSYLDFYPRFLAAGLAKKGVKCHMGTVNIPQLDILRRSTTEMRATNMSRFLTNEAVDDLCIQNQRSGRRMRCRHHAGHTRHLQR